MDKETFFKIYRSYMLMFYGMLTDQLAKGKTLSEVVALFGEVIKEEHTEDLITQFNEIMYLESLFKGLK